MTANQQDIMTSPQVISPTGAPHRPVLFAMPGLEPGAVQVAESLAASGLLRRVLTPLALGDRGWVRRLPAAVRGRLSTRLLPAAVADRAVYYPVREVIRGLSGFVGLSDRSRDRLWYWAETGFDRYVARHWAGRVPVIYGCEHSSVETFVRQKQRGGRTILWQVIAHPRFLNRAICEEFDRFPEAVTPFMRLWLANLERSTARKEQQFDHADLIIANSPFVRETFLAEGFPRERVVCIPTGCPPVPREAEAAPLSGAALTFLNAGGLSIRKGIHLLISAWRKIVPPETVRLQLHGEMQLPPCYGNNLPAGITVGPRLARPELHALFRRCAVFVLPTLAEGRANVVLEALANGLPVLTTPNSGCTDVVLEGRTGFLVPAGDAQALEERLAWCLHHPQELAAMRQNCKEVARSWQAVDFRREHAACIADFVATSSP
jgi:alpha-maltose-1-phosphate synthase